MLSMCLRLFCSPKSATTVGNTAAATIRQAVAIVFDHAVLPRTEPTFSAGGRESCALKLLTDICNMCEGGPRLPAELLAAGGLVAPQGPGRRGRPPGAPRTAIVAWGCTAARARCACARAA
jgi:hypothetical protein